MNSIDISAAENVMRVGLNEDTELNSLLAYYRNKIDEFGKERLEWITKLDECRHDTELKHKLEWENRKLKDKVEELEKALSHHKTALYDERQNYLKLLRENNELKLRQNTDNRKIQDLLNACQPFDGDMVMCKDVRPEISNKFIVNELNIHKHGAGNLVEKSRGSQPLANDKSPLKQKKAAKGTSVPSDLQTTHQLELINLKKVHELEVANLVEQAETLKGELERLQERYEEREESGAKENKNLMARHADLEKKHNSLAQEYFNIRIRLTENEQQTQQKSELLRMKNVLLAQKLQEQEKKYEREQKAIEELVTKRNNDFKVKYKADMRKKQQHLSILKEQYDKVQQIYLAKIKSLQEHLTKLNERYADLNRKYRRESESLKSQLQVMERRVEKEHIEKMRLEIEQLQEEERKKQEQDELEARRLKQDAENKKNKKAEEIKKAYDFRETAARTKKQANKENKQQIEQEEEEEEESMNSSDIENIKKHIRELEAKLELDKNR